jgi:formylglycine-generating enzyme required for sulfatase activity
MTLMLKHLNEPVPDIREFAAGVPDELVAAIEKALAKTPAERFQTAAEMAEALRAIDLTRVAEQAEHERLERERAQQAETERIAREEAERLARQRAEEERIARERAEQERLAKERAEAERAAREEAERLARQKAEEERLARERAEQQRLAKEKAEAERIARQKAEEERLAKERAEAERRARQRAEQERLARERAEQEKRERLAKQKAEQERLAREKTERERRKREIEGEAQPRALPAWAKNRLVWLIGGAVAVVILGVLAVALLLRPVPPSGAGMVAIPGGSYTVGLDPSAPEFQDGNHVPPLPVELSRFYIDQTEATNEQYARFMQERSVGPPSSWDEGTAPAGKEKHPVEGVTWAEATAFCEWAHKRLPTEAEWEVAARGPDGLLYPWGDEENAVPLEEDDTYPVGSVPDNVSAFGVFDMAGNVWEWVDQPYDRTQVEEGHQIIRGGAYNLLVDMAHRIDGDPNTSVMFARAGVRCAASQVEGGE